MGPVLDLKGSKESTMEASTSKDHMTFEKLQKDKMMRPECKHKQGLETCKNEDVDVDIITCTNDDEFSFDQLHSEDDTASSSSFGDTFSDFGNHESDDDVMSQLRPDGVSNDLFPARKKRVTSDWRKFIRPIMWRCKWIELQIKKLQSQAVKYDKELEKDSQRKQLKYKNFELEGHCSKSMPFVHDSKREKPFRRKIRKQREEVDTELYMSQHNIFSYFATQKPTTSGGPPMDEAQTNPATATDKNVGNEFKVPDDLLSLEIKDDNFLEQILWKIEVAQSRVSGMTTRLDTIKIENQGRMSSVEGITLPESNNTLPCVIKETDSPRNRNGQSSVASFASELMKFNTGDELVKQENEGLNNGEGNHLQDVDKPIEQPSRKRNTDEILIYNRRSKKPQTDSGAVKIHPIEKLKVPKEETSEKISLPSVSEHSSSQNEEPAPKLRSVSKLTAPKNKKKRAARARRKSASNLWTRRNSG